MTTKPSVKWAERDDCVYLTIELVGVKDADAKVVLEDSGKLSFAWKEYGFDIQLFKEVISSESKWGSNGRFLVFNIKKKESGYWNRLIPKEAGKPAWIGVDWNRWKDEDDDDEDADANPFANFDFMNSMNGGAAGGAGLPPDFGDLNDDALGEDDLPDLEGDDGKLDDEEENEEKK